MPPINVGIVGLSSDSQCWAAVALAPALRSEPLSSQYTITALSTSSAQSARTAADKYQVTPYHGDTSGISSDPNVTLVAVSVAVPGHKKALIPAIENGKDVFSEWPLGNGLEEARELAEMARKNGVRTMVGTQAWQLPELRKIKDLIKEGKIGRVLSSTFVASKPAEVPYWAPTSPHRSRHCIYPENGATCLDVLIGHNMAAINYVLGPLTHITACSAQKFSTVQFVDLPSCAPNGAPVPSLQPDQYSLIGNLKGSDALFTAAWRGGIPTTGDENANKQRPSLTWIIDGDQGWIRMESKGPMGPFMHVNGLQEVLVNGDLMEIEKGELNNSGRAFVEFAKEEGKGVYPTFEDAVVVHKHIEAIKKSLKEGRKIEVDSL